MLTAMMVVLPFLVVLVLIFLGLAFYAFRMGTDRQNRKLGWRFVWISIPSAVVLGIPGFIVGGAFGFIRQGKSMDYDAVKMTSENVLLTSCVGMELAWLVAIVLSFVFVKGQAVK